MICQKMVRQKTWLKWETHFPFIIVWSKIEDFRLVQGRLLLVDYLSQYELLPFGAL